MADDRTRTQTQDAELAAEALAPGLIVVHHEDPRFVGAVAVPTARVALELGRDSTDFVPGALDDSRVSRRHATIRRTGNRLQVIDCGSHNGTFVNGERVSEAELCSGDVLAVGPVLLLARPVGDSPPTRPHPRFVGTSGELAAVLRLVERAADRDLTALILGESGVGKELVAAELHLLSGRRGPLVSVNCATLADGVVQSELFGHVKGAYSGADSARAGLVEKARGGTLVLDEIGEASSALQANLLRLLQEREARAVGSDRVVQVDARFVAATNRDLAPEVRRGSFREDLYSRLNRCVIRVPPLRERREDILPLARHFASQLTGSAVRLSPSLALALLRHDWPGNVRSLQGLVERLHLELGDRDPWPVPPWLQEELGQHARFEGEPDGGSVVGRKSTSSPESPRKRTKLDGDELRARLVAHDGNVTLLADELGVARNTLYRWIRRDGIDLAKLRDPGISPAQNST